MSANKFDDTVLVTSLGEVAVDQAEEWMNGLTDLRSQDLVNDTILFLKHPKTVAIGLKNRKDRYADLRVPVGQLKREGIAFVQSDRGGGTTFHWPGQLICYPIFALTEGNRDIPGYMHKLEEVALRTLKRLGINAERRRDSAAYLGLWLGNRKVVSMGIKVSKWVTSFGFAVNLKGNIGQAAYIKPCGISSAQLTTLEDELGNAPTYSESVATICEEMCNVFGFKIIKLQCPLLDNYFVNLNQHTDRI